MSLYPNTIDGKIQYFQSKNTPWAANAVAIGTTTGAVTALATKVSSAQAKLAIAIAAREAAKNATADLKLAVRDMVDAGMDIVKQIRTKAAIDGPGVYILAQVPAPALPGPVPAPGQPTNFKVTLNPDGTVKITWKCPNPTAAVGTIYQIGRRVGGSGPFNMVGASGTRSFVDATVPAGVASVTYEVVAVRSTAMGTAGQFTVNFGVSTAGEAFAAVAPASGAPKLAA
jgi:hypothetical protein